MCGSCREGLVCAVTKSERGFYICGLEGSLEDGDCMVLGCNIAEVFRPAVN